MIEKWIKDQYNSYSAMHPVSLPQSHILPAVVFFRISGNEQRSKDTRANHIIEERWQFSIYAKTLEEVRDIHNQLISVYDDTDDTVNNIQRMYIADYGPDDFIEEMRAYNSSIDFYIKRIISVTLS